MFQRRLKKEAQRERNELLSKASSFTRFILSESRIKLPIGLNDQYKTLTQDWIKKLMGHDRVATKNLTWMLELFKFVCTHSKWTKELEEKSKTSLIRLIEKKEGRIEANFVKEILYSAKPMDVFKGHQYDSIKEYSPEIIYNILMLAFLWSGTQEKERSCALLEHVVLNSEPNTFVFFALARVCESHKDEVYNRFSIDLDPSYSLAYNNYGYALKLLGRHEESLEWLQKGLALYPNDILYYTNIASHYFEVNASHESAVELITTTIKRFPTVAKGYYYRAYFCDKIKEYEKALADITKAVKYEPNHQMYSILRATLLMQMNRYDDSISVLTQLIEKSPEDPALYFERGRLSMAPSILDSKWESAMNDMIKVLELSPNRASAHFALGYLFNFREDTEKAIDHYQKAIGCNSEYTHAYHNLAHIYHHSQENYVTALEYYEKALVIDPTFENSLKSRDQVVSQIYSLCCVGNY